MEKIIQQHKNQMHLHIITLNGFSSLMSRIMTCTSHLSFT